MNYQTNQKVKTPIGEGVFDGWWGSKDQAIVRLPVNQETETHLHDENCLTPRATRQALFSFPTSELGQGWIEYLLLIAIMILVLWVIGKVAGWPF